MNKQRQNYSIQYALQESLNKKDWRTETYPFYYPAPASYAKEIIETLDSGKDVKQVMVKKGQSIGATSITIDPKHFYALNSFKPNHSFTDTFLKNYQHAK